MSGAPGDHSQAEAAVNLGRMIVPHPSEIGFGRAPDEEGDFGECNLLTIPILIS
jgi:hypothetical protein